MSRTLIYNSCLVASSKYFSKFFFICCGLVLGPWRSTGFPFLSTMNLVKFHLIASIKVPPCLCFKKAHKGWAPFPLTLIFSKRSKLTLLSFKKHWICSASPGSWPANWLQGKARIRRPLKSIFFYLVSIFLWEYMLYWSRSKKQTSRKKLIEHVFHLT